MDKVLSDYPTATIAQLCQQYADAADALSYARDEEVRKRIRADLNTIFKEIKRRDDEVAALRTELAAANAKVAEFTDELAKANAKAHEAGRILAGLSWQLMGKDE